ncbi:MAG: hypothetical protein M3N10_07270 [Actinomycetota bacterium]|nr:hypothetical protein [Actinomycetota bacterium]HZY64412.1 hypothetical protein [Rubrobacteraceae bacterium]
MKHDKFVAEGKMEIGPKEKFFVFLDGEYVGKLLVDHFQLPGGSGYCDLGRVRLTVESLENDAATETASST